jgi:hypothetical protein
MLVVHQKSLFCISKTDFFGITFFTRDYARRAEARCSMAFYMHAGTGNASLRACAQYAGNAHSREVVRPSLYSA